MTGVQENVRGVSGVPVIVGEPAKQPDAQQLPSLPKLPSSGKFPFAQVVSLLTSKPLRRPNRGKPITDRAQNQDQQDAGQKESASRQLLPYDKLRQLAKKYPPPPEWFDEEQKPF